MTSIPASCSVLTVVLNSLTCLPLPPEKAKRESGAKKPIELYPQ